MRRVRGQKIRNKGHRKKKLPLILKMKTILKLMRRRLRLTLISTIDMRIKDKAISHTVEATATLEVLTRILTQIDLTNMISKIDNLILHMRARSIKDGKQIGTKKRSQNTTTKRRQLLTMSILFSKGLWPKQRKSSFEDSRSLIHL